MNEEKALETAKEQAKAEVLEMIDKYFANHTQAVKNKKLNINKLEELLLQTGAEAEKIIKKAAEAALKASESAMEEKKNVAPDVEQDLQNTAKKK